MSAKLHISSKHFQDYIRSEGVGGYIPHPGQLPFHKSTAKQRWLFGGNRSGKSEAGAAELAMFTEGSQRFRPRPIQNGGVIWVCSVSGEKQREVTQPKIAKWIPREKIVETKYIQRGVIDYQVLNTGWRILYKNYTQDIDTFGGQDVDLIWFDEEPDYREIYISCVMRTLDRGGSIVATMTPEHGMSWVYQEIWENTDPDRDIECFVMDMDQNPHISEAQKHAVLATLTEEEKKIKKEGRFVALHGLIYPQFNEGTHCIEDFSIPKSWRRVVGIDPHLKKATSVVWLAIATANYGKVKRGDWVIYREARRNGETPDIAAMIQVAHDPDERIFAYVIDPAKPVVKEEWPGQNIVDVFAANGIPAQKANKAVEQGIHAVRARLTDSPPTLWVFRSCIGTVWEFKHYMYADPVDQAGKPYSEKIFKRSDDYMDCIRYAINTGIRPARPEDEYRPEPVYTETGRYLGVRNA